MSLLPGYDPQSLQDTISQSMGSASANLTDQYQQQRKRLVADQAASGRLMSGVSDYPLTDLSTGYEKGLSDIQNEGSQQMAGVPAEDWLSTQQFGRQKDLATDIASRLGPSLLEEIFQGIGIGGKVASTVGGFMGE